MTHPARILIAALKGGSGKTLISLGLTAKKKKKALKVSSFKKGPDFIDASWLSLAADSNCYNLDPFMMTGEQIVHSFLSNSKDSDISVIEGNRGLFDGLDLEGRCSTASLARLLKNPVILVVDVSMSTRTVAALVLGCQKFDPELNIAGVILNRVAGPRQEAIIRDSINRYCGIPVVGSISKLKNIYFPERHMGLVPHQERVHAEKAIDWAASIVEENLDLDYIWNVAKCSESLDFIGDDSANKRSYVEKDPVCIGYIRDSSFWFYYPENLDSLKKHGAILKELSSLRDSNVSGVDALYIGGGFPETQAEALANNKDFREDLRQMIEKGLPVYAECGGLIYMGETLLIDENEYPMVGALPVDFVMKKRPQGHGYTILDVDKDNPYFQKGEKLLGHEFHYSKPVLKDPKSIKSVFNVRRGSGFYEKRDGLCKKNLLATYTHLHSGGNRVWSRRLFEQAVNYRKNG